MKLWHVFLYFAASAIITCDSSQRGTSSPRLIGGDEYITKVMQNLIYGMEENGWSNLKLVDVTQTLNEQMYNWHVSGTVNYTNGFVVSIEKIELENQVHTVTSRTVEDSIVMTATMRCNLILRDVKVGFDVIVDLDDQPQQQYTGVFTHSLITIQIFLIKNLNTNQYEAIAQASSLSAGSGVRMIYLPVNHVTQVLSRRYVPGNNFASVRNWCNEIIAPMLQKTAENLEFPQVCFGC